MTGTTKAQPTAASGHAMPGLHRPVAAGPAPARFTRLQRLLHWTMAAAILTMLFVGIGMVATVSPRYATLVAIHKPLGCLILVCAVLRLGVRLRVGVPPLPADLPSAQAIGAKLSHMLLYGLMIAMPLIGWAMLSAAAYPIVLFGAIHLPPIAPHDDTLHAWLHTAHTWLAFVLFAVILLHVAAALFHGLVRQDGVFSSMAPTGLRPRGSRARSPVALSRRT